MLFRSLEAVIAPILARVTREAAVQLLTKAGIACGRLSDMDDLIAHPQRRLAKVATPSGEIEMLAPGVTYPGEELAFGPVPRIGEHSQALRREFGA